MVAIAPAVEADHPVLAKIMQLAMQPDTCDQVLFKDFDHSEVAVEFILSGFKQFGANPDCRIIKAVLEDTGEIVAYAAARFCRAGDTPTSKRSEGKLPPYLNEPFCKDYFGAMGQKRLQYMAGKNFWHWDTLMVLPNHQKKGIGGQLLSWGLASWPIGNDPVWLCAQLAGHKLYQKYGWQDVDDIIMDLSKYTRPYAGYGLHKTVCMLRPPQ